MSDPETSALEAQLERKRWRKKRMEQLLQLTESESVFKSKHTVVRRQGSTEVNAMGKLTS